MIVRRRFTYISTRHRMSLRIVTVEEIKVDLLFTYTTNIYSYQYVSQCAVHDYLLALLLTLLHTNNITSL